MTEARPLRGCEVCGAVDDGPRHVFGWALGDGVTDPDVATTLLENSPPEALGDIQVQIDDSSTTYRHLDCCAAAGCPDGTCDAIVAEAGGKTGDDLVAWLTKGN